MAAWVTFNEAGRLQPVLFLAATRFLGMFHGYYVLPRRLSFFLSFFSLFLNPHPSKSSLFFSHLTSFRLSPFRAPAHASMVVHRHALVLFPTRSIVKLLRVGAGTQSCALPKECRPFFPKTAVSWLV